MNKKTIIKAIVWAVILVAVFYGGYKYYKYEIKVRNTIIAESHRTDELEKFLMNTFPTQTQAYIATRNAQLQTTTNMKPVAGPYAREVTRSEDLFCLNKKTGLPQSYTATSVACSKCVKGSTSTHPSPKCYGAACNKCKMFGHTAPDCKQVVTAFGNFASTSDEAIA